MFKNDKTYDTLKNVALLIVPIFAWIASIVNICGVPYAETITAILTATDTMIGGLVVVAKKIHDGKTEEGEKDD